MSDNQEQRDFPVSVIASLSSGTLLCKFSEMHEAAEFLMGHPIWTHHFADKQLCGDMKRAIAEQYPSLPTKHIEGLNEDNYRDYAAKLEAEFGKTIRIRKGSGLTAMLPTDGIPDHLKDRTILVKP